MTKKRCTKCGRRLDHSEFNKHKNHKDGLQYRCKECRSKHRKEKNADLKLEVINALGGRCIHVDKNGVQCPKNSIDDLGDLDLIHPNGDGNEHRNLISNGHSGQHFYRELKKIGYDTGKFVVWVMCRAHHCSLDKRGKKGVLYGKYGKLHPKYKEGKFNDPVWLRKQYEIMSSYQIADLCGISHMTVLRRMVKFNIERRKPGPHI